ncbi:MAG: hypothetical protein V1860_00260 [bacterium]
MAEFFKEVVDGAIIRNDTEKIINAVGTKRILDVVKIFCTGNFGDSLELKIMRGVVPEKAETFILIKGNSLGMYKNQYSIASILLGNRRRINRRNGKDMGLQLYECDKKGICAILSIFCRARGIIMDLS